MTAKKEQQQPMANVSRETRAQLDRYLDLLRKWTAKINLVAPGTLEQAWERHFLDSLQLLSLVPSSARLVVDFGSGGGFPGMVMAVADSANPDRTYHLVESDKRKCAFLRSVRRETSASVTIHESRIEALEPLNAGVAVARALAPLPLLLEFAHRHLGPGGRCLFLKGEKAKQEIHAARAEWQFSCVEHPSMTSEDSVILEIGDLVRA